MLKWVSISEVATFNLNVNFFSWNYNLVSFRGLGPPPDTLTRGFALGPYWPMGRGLRPRPPYRHPLKEFF